MSDDLYPAPIWGVRIYGALCALMAIVCLSLSWFGFTHAQPHVGFAMLAISPIAAALWVDNHLDLRKRLTAR